MRYDTLIYLSLFGDITGAKLSMKLFSMAISSSEESTFCGFFGVIDKNNL
jgi:hypothetical protein